jgi:hypothetical protein
VRSVSNPGGRRPRTTGLEPCDSGLTRLTLGLASPGQRTLRVRRELPAGIDRHEHQRLLTSSTRSFAVRSRRARLAPRPHLRHRKRLQDPRPPHRTRPSHSSATATAPQLLRGGQGGTTRARCHRRLRERVEVGGESRVLGFAQSPGQQLARDDRTRGEEPGTRGGGRARRARVAEPRRTCRSRAGWSRTAHAYPASRSACIARAASTS